MAAHVDTFASTSMLPSQSQEQSTQHGDDRSKKPKQPDRPPSGQRTASQDNGITKAKQSKSRNGCATCKAKRLKCDETKPSCLNCQKRKVTCGGYKKEFKWRSSNEDSFDIKTFTPPTKPNNSKPPSSTPVESSSSRHSPVKQGSFQSTFTTAFSSAPPSSSSLSNTPRSKQQTSTSPNEVFARPFGTLPPPTPPSQLLPQFHQPFQPVPTSQPMQSPQFTSPQNQGFRPRMPSISDILSQDNQFNQFNGQLPELQNPISMHDTFPNGWNMPLQVPQSDLENEEDEDIEEIVRTTMGSQNDTIWPPDDAVYGFDGMMNQQDLTVARVNDPPMFMRPQLDMSNWEMLLSAFDRNTTGIMSVRNAFGENPWKTLVAPLLGESPALRYAIAAMSSLHASIDNPALREQGLRYIAASSHELIENPNESPIVALASTLALGFADSWDLPEGESRSGLDYVKIARTLVPRILNERHFQRHSREELERINFLCKTWIYIDVIARLTSIDEDASDECNEVSLQLSGPTGIETKIDPLMGSASTLFPIIGRVANLIRRVCKSDVNTPDIIGSAVDLKSMLENWNPPAPFPMPLGDNDELENSLHTAEAYRWSTLLYLHQAVPEIPSPDSESMARQVISHLLQVPMDSQIVIVQIYPLLAAGCEVDDQPTRTWIENRWFAMDQRMRIGNIRRCLQVVREVWRRRDKYNMSNNPLQRSSSMPQEYGNLDDGTFSFDSPRRATFSSDTFPARRHSMDWNTGNIDHEFTVRGSLHWVSVMKENKWEILLG